ncbi:MAG: methyltransferase, partial [Candidatus Woesearchaeota archaeon]|nr:methyltransferase [Candidatus Woesearchaeota archaeon]
NWRVLDLGCGYGPVGIALVKAHPDLLVVMSDVNARAVKLARKNSAQNKVEIKHITSDGFAHIIEQFNTILLNPPQTAGKKVCERLIAESKEHLVSGGLLQIVARHNKGGAQLEKFMKELFGNSNQVAKQSGFRVYVSRKD